MCTCSLPATQLQYAKILVTMHCCAPPPPQHTMHNYPTRRSLKAQHPYSTQHATVLPTRDRRSLYTQQSFQRHIRWRLGSTQRLPSLPSTTAHRPHHRQQPSATTSTLAGVQMHPEGYSYKLNCCLVCSMFKRPAVDPHQVCCTGMLSTCRV